MKDNKPLTSRQKGGLTKKSKLSVKEKNFGKEFVSNGGNGVQAALKTYNTNSYTVAGSIATENLKKPKVTNYIESIADQIPDALLVERHIQLLNKTTKVYKNNMTTGEVEEVGEEIDGIAVKSGLDMAYKLKGSYAAEKKDVTHKGFSLADLFNNNEPED